MRPQGILNRFIWALSPAFLGGYFPGMCSPDMLTDWRVHVFFLIVSLTPFVLADVAFPYVVGSDTELKILLSTCFWPTFTCVFFLPSMIAGLRRCDNDEQWSDLLSQPAYIRKAARRDRKSH